MYFSVKILRNLFTVSGWTFVSRIFGYIRDIFMAGLLGSGPVGEAFIIAFSLPNIFRRFLAEGAFSAAFIPLFKKHLSNKSEASYFASNTFSMLILVLLVLCSVALIFMPFFVLAMASGFGSDERLSLAVEYGRILFPYIFVV